MAADAGDLLCTAMSPCPCYQCREKRSGCSQSVARYAHPGRNKYYDGYYVGGGAALRGEPRCRDDGTWGWDYVGVIPKLVRLGWWHGRRYQGGTGAYKTDGPHLAHHE